MKNSTGGNKKEAGSVWELGFVYCRAGFVLFEWDLDLFLMYSQLLIATGWLYRWQNDFLKDPDFSVLKRIVPISFHLAIETETVCKQELLKLNIKLEKALKALRWLWKWKDEFSVQFYQAHSFVLLCFQ